MVAETRTKTTRMTTAEYTNTDSKRYCCSQCNRIIESETDHCACGQPINLQTGDGLATVILRERTNGTNRSQYGAYLNEKRFCLKCGDELAYDESALKEVPCAGCGRTYDIFDARSYVKEERPRKMYCQGCWEALDIHEEKCNHCGLAFEQRNASTYYSSRPRWKWAFSIPGHLIWPGIIVLGIRFFGGPLPWPWWATFIGLSIFSTSSSFRVTSPERERKMRNLGKLHRFFVFILIALTAFVTTYAWP